MSIKELTPEHIELFADTIIDFLAMCKLRLEV